MSGIDDAKYQLAHRRDKIECLGYLCIDPIWRAGSRSRLILWVFLQQRLLIRMEGVKKFACFFPVNMFRLMMPWSLCKLSGDDAMVARGHKSKITPDLRQRWRHAFGYMRFHHQGERQIRILPKNVKRSILVPYPVPCWVCHVVTSFQPSGSKRK